MRRFVLDCSVSAAWCLKDETGSRSQRYLDMLTDGEAVVPSLWVVEMANVLLVAQRRKRIGPKDVGLAMELVSELPITVHDETAGLMARLHALADKRGLSAYDTCYLDLALRLKLPLASLDRRQRAAASALSVELL